MRAILLLLLGLMVMGCSRQEGGGPASPVPSPQKASPGMPGLETPPLASVGDTPEFERLLTEYR